jgi:hypothetical protein
MTKVICIVQASQRRLIRRVPPLGHGRFGQDRLEARTVGGLDRSQAHLTTGERQLRHDVNDARSVPAMSTVAGRAGQAENLFAPPSAYECGFAARYGRSAICGQSGAGRMRWNPLARET